MLKYSTPLRRLAQVQLHRSPRSMSSSSATPTPKSELPPLPFGAYVRLRDGHSLPQLGFGVYEVSGRACRDAVSCALESGYRLIDSAEWYGNEAECGATIRAFCEASKTPREQVYFTTKLMSSSTYAHARAAIDASLRKAGVEIDLYLLHSPYPSKGARLESWRALVDAQRAGLVRSIGVSNWGRRHLEELKAAFPDGPMPSVNQIDVHPFMTRAAEVAYNAAQGIAVEAWGPLARGERMQHPRLLEVAKKHGKTAAQVLVRWSLQHGYICIPKSVKRARIEENRDVFDFTLDEGDMRRLDELDEYLVTDWDPIGDSSV